MSKKTVGAWLFRMSLGASAVSGTLSEGSGESMPKTSGSSGETREGLCQKQKWANSADIGYHRWRHHAERLSRLSLEGAKT